MKTKKQLTNRILSLVLTFVMVLGMLPMSSLTAFAASDYAYIDADGSHKSVSSATEITSSTTTWNNGWYYVGANVTISSRITVSGDVKLILGAGYTLTASEGIWVSGGNTLTVYSQQAVGSLVATGVEYSAAIGGNGKAGTSGANVNTSVGTIIINGGNITATGGDHGAAIGTGWGGSGGSFTINGGNITATGGPDGAGIGSSQDATGKMYITINGGTVNATGGLGAAAIGTGYGAEDSNAAVIEITGGNITAGRNWSSASIGNGTSSHCSTTITATGGVIDADLIGNYNGDYSAVIDLCGAGFKKDPTSFLDSRQYAELKEGLYYVYWKKASAVISTSTSGNPSVWVNGVATSHTGTRYESGKLYIYGIPAGDVKASLNGTDYYGVLTGTSDEKELKAGYAKVTSITLNVASITAGAPIDLANYVVLSPKDLTFEPTISFEVVAGSTTSAYTLNGSVLTASAGKVTVKVTANDGYSVYSGTFGFNVAASDELDIAYGNIEISQNAEGNYDVSYAGFTGGKKTYGATEAIVISGTTEEYSVKVLSGTPTVVLNNCNITTWVTNTSTISPFAISSGATVYLMLQGESTLKLDSTANVGNVAAIAVPEGAALHINGTGILNVTGKKSGGAIGGRHSDSLGDVTIDGGTINAGYYARNTSDSYYGTTISGANITINGGTVTAKAGMSGSAIGSSYHNTQATTVTINGGVVNAIAEDYGNRMGVAIGNAYLSEANCSVTINGGTVTALSEKGAGAAIGSAQTLRDADVTTSVTINGGTVTAEGFNGAGIGGAYYDKNSLCAVTINGGTVIASGRRGAGIGGGYSGKGGTVTITGGNIKATSTYGNAVGSGENASEECVVSDGKGNALSLNAITLEGAATNTVVSAIKGVTYGLKDVKTLDADKLYFYLPSGTVATAITAGGKEYFCASTGLNYRTSHDWSNSDGICANCGMECAHVGEVDQCSVCGAALHTHQWEYNVSGTAIRAVCKADGCPNDGGGSVTLNVSDAYFTGSAIGATVTGSFTNGATYKVTYNDSETVPSSIGTHTVKLTVYENGNEKQSVTAQYEISYLPAPNPAYTISGAYEDNGTYWFKTGAVAEVSAPNGFMISTTLGGTYGAFVYLDEGDSKTVYLKRVSDGALTDVVNVEGIRFDGNGATGEITIENRGFWEKLFNKITFGLFFKGDAVAKVSAMDDESGWKSIQYYVADEDLINDGDTSVLETAIGNNWKDYSDEIALNKNAKNVIYVKITDNVGNVTYISSDGIVLYSDAEAVTESVSTTYKAGTDKDVTVKLNGNTVNEIKNGDDVLAGADYSVSANGTITLKASYLDTLSAGTYTFTVSYNPLGKTFMEAPRNDAPKATTFKVVVEKADGKVSNINIGGKTYDGTAVTAPTFDKLSDGAATIEYKIKGADDSTYTTTAPNAAEDYIVRVTVAEGTNYKAASATAEFTISRATLKDVSVQQNGTLTYNGGKALTPAVIANATALNGADVLFMYSADGNSYGEMPTFTDAGTYTVYYQAYTTDNNFIDQYGTFTVTIDKAIVTEPTIAGKPFNNAVQKADISDTDLYTVVKNNGGTAKGSYDVVLKLKDADNYKWSTTDNAEVTVQFVISAAQNAWETKPAISGWTYGETAKTPVGAAKYGTVKVVYSGTANDGSDYNSETAPTKAGSYTATFTVEGTEDYSGLSEQVNFTIAKKAVTVTANDASKTYGDSDPTFTYTHTDLVGSDALVITVARASGENANTYTITASQAEGANPNYEITFKNGTFTIRKAALTVTVEDKTATYGDAVPTYTVKYDGFKNSDDKDDLGGTLAFDCDYAQFSDKGEYTIKASGYTSGNYTINYVDGKLTVSAKPITVTIQNATSIYGEALAELKATDNGIVNGDKDVYSLATVATSTSNVGKYAITGTALDSNYAITFVNGEYEITKREITITVEAKNTIVNTALPTYTYKVEGLVGEDKLETEPTLASNADITVIGEYDITATDADAGGNYSIKYVPAKLTVLTDNAVDAAAGYTEELKGYEPATVTSEDKAELDEILNEINTILEDENITDNGKKALEEVKEQVEKLIKEITDAAEATDTENVGKVENVTPENVTPENKTDLEGAKADLEKALEDHGSNMTEDEKKAIEDEIKRIDDALTVIEDVEAVEELIDKLPDTIKKDDEAAIKAADDAYNALSDYEKSLVDEDVKKDLDDAKAALAELNKPADSTSPDTGDNSNMFLWIALLFISGGAVITLTVVDRKRKAVKR